MDLHAGDDSQRNPYAAPQAAASPPNSLSPADLLREDLTATANLFKGIGGGYFLIGAFIGFLAVIFLIVAATDGGGIRDFLPGVVSAGTSLALLWLAFLLGTLQFTARRSIYGLACFALLVFPLGTILGFYLFHQLKTAKGQRVFDPEQLQLMRVAPFVDRRPPA